MSIGLIIPSNRKNAPYVEYYINILQKEHIEYKLLVWDKRGLQEDVDYAFHYSSSDYDRKQMFLGHILFANWCRKIIRREQFGQLIVFTIAPAFMLNRLLYKRYQGRYILDIRDDSPFRRRFPTYLNKLSEAAGLIVTSSPAYAKWINRDSILCHNVDLNMLREHRDYTPSAGNQKPIRIVFAGAMNEQKINMEIIEQLKNRDDILLSFIGRRNKGKEEIEDYVKTNGIKNVVFQGEYKKDEIAGIYRREADLINIFRIESEVNRNALPNKLYDAVLSGVPVIVYDHNAEIANYVQAYHLGIVLSAKDQEPLVNVILREIAKFDYCTYTEGRRKFLDKVDTDMQQYEQAVLQLMQ